MSIERPTVTSSADPESVAARAGLCCWLATCRRARLWADWHWQLRHALDADGLAARGLIDPTAQAVGRRYPARVTPYYLSLVDWDDPADPIRRQCLPDVAELAPEDTGAADPFGECRPTGCPGLVHRFPDRVLVLVATQCAVRCRHCTRKNTLEQQAAVAGPAGLRRAVDYVRAHPEVREVILSGGDPLLLGDARLLALVRAFTRLPQVDAVRIGTRVPAAMPMRVTPNLARALGASRRVWVNTQFNHARELTPEAAEACARLVDAGIPVSNQSVLLRGVNDNLPALVALCAGLQRIRVRPYYLFVCDPICGVQHLRVSVRRARALGRELTSSLGGLALPHLVMDVPGAPCKRPV